MGTGVQLARRVRPSRDELDSATWKLISEELENAEAARNLKEFCARAAAAAGRLVPHDVGCGCFSFEGGLPRWLAGEPAQIGIGFNEKYRYLIPITDMLNGGGMQELDFSGRGDEAYVRDYLSVIGIKYTLGALDGDFQLCVYRSSPARPYSAGEVGGLHFLRLHMASVYRWLREAERALRLASLPALPSAPPALLTRRELEVLSCLERGMTAREIGVALAISPRTAERHTANIFDKLCVGSRPELAERLAAAAAEAPRASSRGREPMLLRPFDRR